MNQTMREPSTGSPYGVTLRLSDATLKRIRESLAKHLNTTAPDTPLNTEEDVIRDMTSVLATSKGIAFPALTEWLKILKEGEKPILEMYSQGDDERVVAMTLNTSTSRELSYRTFCIYADWEGNVGLLAVDDFNKDGHCAVYHELDFRK